MGEPNLTSRRPAAPTVEPRPSPNGDGAAAGGRPVPAGFVPVHAPPAPPPAPPTPAEQPEIVSADAGERRSFVTVETLLYFAILATAVVTRFWDLGSRALHHDESLHAYYSWLYATGQGYTHDPLMHGPFLFHADALAFLLFGATDASSRFMPALFGVALVGLPYLLRGPRHLGRWGALAASCLLLISPAILYQSRYIRHDIFTLFGSLLLFAAVVRYLEAPARRWLVTIALAIAFLLTNHEIVFGIVAVFAAVLWGALLLGSLRALVPVHLVVAGLALALLALQPGPLGLPFPEIPWDRRGSESPMPNRENQFAFYRDVLTHPLVIALAVLLVLAIVAGLLLMAGQWGADRPGLLVGAALLGGAALAVWLAALVVVDQTGQTVLGRLAPPAFGETGRLIAGLLIFLLGVVLFSIGAARWRRALPLGDDQLAAAIEGANPGSVEHAALATLRDRAGLALAFVAGFVLFAALFTTLFTNLYGLVSATVATDGTLFYWLGQHDYRRGEQPWFYYLLLFPQYEFFAVLFGAAATLLTGWQTLLIVLRRARPGPRFFFRLVLVIWFLAILAALSWAGEKMPWLVTHIALPGTLLAAALLGDLAERWRGAKHEARGTRHEAKGAGEAPRGHDPVAGDLSEAGPVAPSDAVAERGAESRRPRSAVRPVTGWGLPEGTVVGTLLLLAGGWFFLAGRLSYGVFVPSELPGGFERAVTEGAAGRWSLLALPPLAAIALVALLWWRRGPRRAGETALVALVAVIALLQIHAGWRMTYLEGDIPKDMLIYTQTSPDVHHMVRELELLSAELTGGQDLEIWFDGDPAWPLNWYLRDFPNKRYSTPSALDGGTLSSAPVIITDRDILADIGAEQYTAQEYVLRWWFPEDEIYRKFAIAPELAAHRSAWGKADNPHGPVAIARSVLDSLAAQLTRDGQQRLYRILVYRDLPYPIGHSGGSARYTIYIRSDLLPLFNEIRY